MEAEFSLDIINVTHEDDGFYFCQMFCRQTPPRNKSPIQLKTVARAQSNGTIGNIFSKLKKPVLNDVGDGIENKKKAICLLSKMTNLHVRHSYFVHFFALVAHESA